MKKQKIMGITAGAIVLTGCGMGVTSALTNNLSTVAANVKNDNTIAVSDLVGSSNIIADETIYVFTGADGKITKTIKSLWEQNQLGEDSFAKVQTNVDVPVTVAISYKLDGKEISGKDLVGKSGKIGIKIQYTNNSKNSAGIYTPYAAISGMIMDGAKFKNVEVKNGKVMNDGGKYIVTGVALPGMNESLGVNNVLPDTVEISANVADFEMGMMMSLATSEVFSDMDTEELNSVEALTGKLDELVNGVAQLDDGAKSLKSGAGELASGAKELDAGVGSLQNGVSELGEKLSGAAEQSDALRGGMETIVGKVLDSANTEFRSKVKADIAQVVRANYPSLPDEQVEAQVSAQMEMIPDLTLANYAAVFESLKTNYPAFAGTIDDAKGQYDLLSTFHDGIIAYTEGMDLAAEKVNGDLKSGVDALRDGSSKLASGADALASGAGSLSDGMETLNASVKQMAEKLQGYDGVVERAKATFEAAKGKNKIKYIYRSTELKH